MTISTHSGKNILLTGVTGFVGMAVIERMLRHQFATIEHIYCLVRSSKGESSSTRLEKAFKNPVFGLLHEAYPDFPAKVTAIEADLVKPGFGISDEDTVKLVNSVDVIVHCAASVDFNLPLIEAFNINTLGAVKILEIAEKCLKLQGIVHVSTAYANCDKKGIVIEEKIYPNSVGDAQHLIESISSMDAQNLASLEKCVLEKYPNTYTFTKSLAEHVYQTKSDKWNIAIVRPSIVTPAMSSPFPGWAHGLAAGNGVTALVGLGVLDMMPAREETIVDVIPVDCLASDIVSVMNGIARANGLTVYHATSSASKPVTWEMYRLGVLAGWKKQPKLSKQVRPPSLQLVPDYDKFVLIKEKKQKMFLEMACKVAKKDTDTAAKILKLINHALTAEENFTFFFRGQWIFDSTNTSKLNNTLGLQELNWNDYLFNMCQGIRYIMDKIPYNNLPNFEVPQSSEVKA